MNLLDFIKEQQNTSRTQTVVEEQETPVTPNLEVEPEGEAIQVVEIKTSPLKGEADSGC